MKALFFSFLAFFSPALPAAEPEEVQPASARLILCGVSPKASGIVTEISKGSGEIPAPESSPETSRSGENRSRIEIMISDLTPQERNSLLALLNHGTREDLIDIKGIAGRRADTILSSRPIFELQDLAMLRGFGPGLIARVLEHKDKAMQ